MLNVESAYKEWLKGSSLRAIGNRLGIPHGSLHSLFRKTYGKTACSLKAKSLVRSLVSDYEGNNIIVAWALTHHMEVDECYHKSKHSLQQLSNFQTLREEYLLDTVEAAPWLDPDDVSLDFLRLPLYLTVNDAIMNVLAKAIFITAREAIEDTFSDGN